jgi:hypothetical protein
MGRAVQLSLPRTNTWFSDSGIGSSGARSIAVVLNMAADIVMVHGVAKARAMSHVRA